MPPKTEEEIIEEEERNGRFCKLPLSNSRIGGSPGIFQTNGDDKIAKGLSAGTNHHEGAATQLFDCEDAKGAEDEITNGITCGKEAGKVIVEAYACGKYGGKVVAVCVV